MESRLAWRRAVAAAQQYRVTVLCGLLDAHADDLRAEGVDVLHVPPSRWERRLARLPGGSNLAYARWQRRAYRVAQAKHEREPFDIAHHVSYCGYRQPSHCWRLDIPYIWGPIGGTHAFPRQFFRAIEPLGAIREAVRNGINAVQLRWSPGVRQAIRHSTCVLAASRQSQRELTTAGLRIDGVMLETGVDAAPAPAPPRKPQPNDEPLRILWAGRACSWKALPLLLRALAGVSPACLFQLRVMSAGPQLKRWQRLADRLGLADRVEWVGWPGCTAREPHYQWADAFAFTSLRDTSGTGLLEALAAGAPIVGVDHQGAADVMTDRCAIRVPVTSPTATIEGFRAAIELLARDRGRLAALSAGALERARQFRWDVQSKRLLQAYDDALAPRENASPARLAQPSQPARNATASATTSPAETCTAAASQ